MVKTPKPKNCHNLADETKDDYVLAFEDEEMFCDENVAM